jgi:catechol 2,3-dioxygenase-like lactoylglutathione lyase family enzyme
MQLQLVIIFAKEMSRMTAFYRDGLGLRYLADESAADWAKFDAGGAQLALHEIPAPIAKNIEIADPPVPREDSAIKLVFETNDLQASRAHLTVHGAIMSEPREGRCDGLDPEGNVFTIRTR